MFFSRKEGRSALGDGGKGSGSNLYLLLHNLELLDQNASKLLNNMRAVVSGLEAHDDLLYNIIVNVGQVNLVVGSVAIVVVEVHFDGDSSVKTGGGWWGVVGDELAAFVGRSGRVS